MKSNEYIKFVISKIESDFRIYAVNEELRAVLLILNTFSNSGNILRDIYLLSGVKKFRQLCTYLLFVIKKAEEGKINYENLLENIDLDKEFIESQLLTYFNVLAAPSVERIKEEKKEQYSFEPSKKKDEINNEYTISGRSFFVEELEEEIVAEEFSESDMLEEYDLSSGGKYLELVPSNPRENDAPYSLENFIGDNPEEKRAKSLTGEESEASGEKFTADGDATDAVKKAEQKTGISQTTIPQKTEDSLSSVDNDDVFSLPVPIYREQDKKTQTSTEEEINTREEEINAKEEESTCEINQKTEDLISEKIQQDLFAGDDADINVKQETGTSTEPEEKPAEQNEPSAEFSVIEESNSVYLKYETELFSRNGLLSSDIEKLILYSNNNENIPEAILYEKIIENSHYMAGYSAEMSFEIITSIYLTIKKVFETKQSDSGFIITVEKLHLLREGISVIESLIKGDDTGGFAGADKFFKRLELYKHTIENRAIEKEKTEKAIQQKEEFSRHLEQKFPDNTQREKLRALHAHIMEVEKIFISLAEIKGEYQAYEALRRLSATFSHFKECVSIANSLDMFRMAQLAEASYIFIKFMRNYRVNPFEEDIDEVFKYLIDSFKRVFLDKPVKDIDLFLTYLNDPVKIISQKK